MKPSEPLAPSSDETSTMMDTAFADIDRGECRFAADRDVTASIALFDDRSPAGARTTTHVEPGTVRLEFQGAVEARARSDALSRCMNVAIAFVALMVGLPIMLAVALLVRLTSHGPVMYRQVRIGVDRRRRTSPGHRRPDDGERREYDQGGKPFRMYKFRTMRVDAEADGRAVWALARDPRTTPLGRFLRRARLDELPQLYNVLTGDMNMVGPRPERPTIFATLRSEIVDYPARQRVRPGITGLAQISHPYDTSINDVRRKVEYDLAYIERRGLVEDLRIMTLTLPVMLGQRKGW